MNFYSIGNLDLVTLEGGASYDGDLADGYFILDGKIVIFCMYDKQERGDILFRRKTHKIDHSSSWMTEKKDKDFFSEPHLEAYWIKNPQEIVPESDIPSQDVYWTLAKGRNAIMNSELNRILNEFVNKHHAIAYYMRFNHYEDKDYVTIGYSFYYDKDRINGYFLRDGHIVILYDTGKLSDGSLLNPKDVMKNRKEGLKLHSKEETTWFFGQHIEKYQIEKSKLTLIDSEAPFYPDI